MQQAVLDGKVHNHVGLVNNLNDILREFSIETQKQFEHLSGMIEDANHSGLLDPENYEQLLKREKFDAAYKDLIEDSCMSLSTKMQGFLFDLAKKMEEYNAISIS